MANSQHLALYYFESCPYCQVVLRVINELNLKVELRDIMSSREHLNKLVADTARRTVPCLYIDGKPMHESAEITKWLKSHAGLLEKRA